MVAGNELEGPFSELTIHPPFFTMFGCHVQSGVSLHSTTLLQRVVYITHRVQNMYLTFVPTDGQYNLFPSNALFCSVIYGVIHN